MKAAHLRNMLYGPYIEIITRWLQQSTSCRTQWYCPSDLERIISALPTDDVDRGYFERHVRPVGSQTAHEIGNQTGWKLSERKMRREATLAIERRQIAASRKSFLQPTLQLQNGLVHVAVIIEHRHHT